MKNKTHEMRNLLDGTNKRLDTEEEKKSVNLGHTNKNCQTE